MLISQIDLFIHCAKALIPKHESSNLEQKRQIETFLKTWLFYNSSSAEVFWTGYVSKSVINGADSIAEHWYGNLSSVHYIMNPDTNNNGFFDQPKHQQILEVFKFMQWNKTSKAENIKLRALQRPEIFFSKFDGDPRIIYKEAGINLIRKSEDRFYEIKRFFNYGNNKKINQKKTIFDIGMSPSKRLSCFIENLMESSTNINLQTELVRVGNKGCFYRINNDGLKNSMANFYRITMTSLWKLFNNQEEVDLFLSTYKYRISDKGPYRHTNTFDSSHGNYSFCINLRSKIAPNTIWLWTRYNDERKYLQIMELFEFFGARLVVYDYNLDLRKLGKQTRN